MRGKRRAAVGRVQLHQSRAASSDGNGTFTDVSEASGILQANGTFGLGVLTADFDNDGWPDIYVANDSTASALYRTRKMGNL